jgi:hypothetical protein
MPGLSSQLLAVHYFALVCPSQVGAFTPVAGLVLCPAPLQAGRAAPAAGLHPLGC